MPICLTLTDDQIIRLIAPLMGLLGVFIGWWLSLLTIAKTRKMKCLDRFFEAVAFEIGDVLRLPDNMDKRLSDFHLDSVRRLEGIAGCVEAQHKKEWKKIEASWLDYKNLIDVDCNGIGSSLKHGLVTRAIIMNQLRNLLGAANQ